MRWPTTTVPGFNLEFTRVLYHALLGSSQHRAGKSRVIAQIGAAAFDEGWNTGSAPVPAATGPVHHGRY